MKKFSLSSFAAGILCTVAVLGLGTTAYAAYVNLNPSSTKLVVDGTAVNVTGYNVENRNYFQLRELAKIFNVSLEWEAATDTAYMDSSKPYTEETPTPVTTPPMSGTLANGKAITDENILTILAEIEKEYPDGTAWGASERYYSAAYGLQGGCNAWAYMVSDRIFGKDTPYVTHSSIDDVRIGDIVQLNDKTTGESVHYFVVRNKIEVVTVPGLEPYVRILFCDGNSNGQVSWQGNSALLYMKSQYTFVVYSRYPA